MGGLILDIRTLMLVNSLLVASLAFVIMYVRFTRRVYPGFDHWVAAQWFWAIGFVLLALRGQIPDWVSILIANALIFSTYLLLLAGLRKFFGLSARIRAMEWVLMLIMASFYLWFYFVDDSTHIRSLIATLFYLTFGLLIFALIFRQPQWWRSKALIALTGALTFLLGLHLIRLGFLLLAGLKVDHLFNDPSLAALAVLLPISSVFMTFSLILLTYERTEDNLVRAEQRAQELARIDVLTGAWNRRHAEDCAEIEAARSRREERPLSVMIFDVDLFKAINDCYGHAVGDEVLRRVTEVCQSTVREVDIVVRWGGEEFLVLLPGTSLDGAGDLAERLRLALHQIEITVSNAPPVQVRASFGVASLLPQEGFEHMVGRADDALYRAKQAGRDRVEVAQPS